MKKQTIYTEVPVSERLPEQGVYVTWVMSDGLSCYGFMDESCGNWWAYIYNDEGETDAMSPNDFVYWIEKHENKIILSESEMNEIKKKVAGDAFDAGFKKCGENMVDHMIEISKPAPDKEQYLTTL